MEREQRSEELLRDFIRANCQRMKHELANRDCRQGRYRRDPRAAAAVTPPPLRTWRVKRTHAITPPTRGVSPLTGQIWSHFCQRRGARRSEHPHPDAPIQTSKWALNMCASICLPPCLPLTALVSHVLEKWSFFIVSEQFLLHTVPQ